MSDEVWEVAATAFDQGGLSSLVQVTATIDVFNRIEVATERDANFYAEYASQR